MDNETKQIFEQLIEAINNNRVDSSQLVEAVDSPDWWTIGITSAITVVNAAIMVWLGWKQYKLQKRQTEAQDYNIYRKLYILLRNANIEIDYYLDRLSNALWEPQYNADKEFLQRWQASIDKLRKDLGESYVDYELKLAKETFDKKGYWEVLSLMSHIIQQTIISLQQGDVHLTRGMHSFSFEQGKKDEAFATDIARQYKGGALPSIMMREFANFIQLKRSVRCDDSLLESIKAKCKID